MKFKIRSILFAFLLLPLTINVNPRENSINVFEEVIEALSAAADALVSFTDAIEHIVATGNDGFRYVNALRDYNRLIDLSADLTEMHTYSNYLVVESIDEYLRIVERDMGNVGIDYGWSSVQDRISIAIEHVYLIFDDIRKERSDFVLEEAYSVLSATLSSRVNLLSRLQKSPPPKSPEEVEALREINKKYKKLIKELKSATDSMKDYLKKFKKGQY